VLVQACLNGARPAEYHSRLPLSAATMAEDGWRCVAAGASELHIHARDGEGRESLFAVDETIRATRAICPGTLVGVSTGEWIENDPGRTLQAIESWSVLPDYASVNLSEPDAPAVMEMLKRRGVGIEAGLATPADAKRLAGLAGHGSVLRVLIEIEEQDKETAFAAMGAIARILEENEIRKPILLHGFDAAMWPLIQLAFKRRWSTRVGLEDGRELPDGTIAPDNAALVRQAMAMRAALNGG
jgi:uncharacterized protein (DUF849 family)